MFFAHEEASTLGRSSIGTEHMFLGLLREERGVAAQILAELGVDYERVRQQVAMSNEPAVRRRLPYSPRTKEALGLSLYMADELRHDHVDTGHVLLGLLQGAEYVTELMAGPMGEQDSICERVIRRMSAPDYASAVATSESRSSVPAISASEDPCASEESSLGTGKRRVLARSREPDWPWVLETWIEPPDTRMVGVRDATRQTGAKAVGWPQSEDVGVRPLVRRIRTARGHDKALVFGITPVKTAVVRLTPAAGEPLTFDPVWANDEWWKAFAHPVGERPEGIVEALAADKSVISASALIDVERHVMDIDTVLSDRVELDLPDGPHVLAAGMLGDELHVQLRRKGSPAGRGHGGVPVPLGGSISHLQVSSQGDSLLGPRTLMGEASKQVVEVRIQLDDGRLIAAHLVEQPDLPVKLFIAAIPAGPIVTRIAALDASESEIDATNTPFGAPRDDTP